MYMSASIYEQAPEQVFLVTSDLTAWIHSNLMHIYTYT